MTDTDMTGWAAADAVSAPETAGGIAADAGLDWADQQRIGFLMDNLAGAAAPSNNPVRAC